MEDTQERSLCQETKEEGYNHVTIVHDGQTSLARFFLYRHTFTRTKTSANTFVYNLYKNLDSFYTITNK